MPPRLLLAALLALAFCGCRRSAVYETPPVTVVRVAAAADLRAALDEAAAAFRERRPFHEVRPTYAASGTLYAQITNAAPFDLYLSADTEYPRKLVEAGRGVPGTEFRYAVGKLVLWARPGLPEVADLGGLRDPAFRKVALANPATAPYGRAAEAALKAAGVHDDVRDKLVFGENVAQAAQFAESGAADAALVAHTQTLAPALRDKGGRAWAVPPHLYPRLVQGGVILEGAQDRAAAAAFRDYLTGPEGQALLARHGFEPPEE